MACSYHEQVGKDHGRLERRQCRVITDPEELAYVDPHGQWASLGAVAQVSYQRDSDASSSTDTRYYICSYPADAARLLAATRSHWSIENSLHWVLDVAFDEDHSRVRTGHADQKPGGDSTPGTEPSETGTQRKSRNQGQTQKGRLGLRLPDESPIPVKCDCPAAPAPWFDVGESRNYAQVYWASLGMTMTPWQRHRAIAFR